MTGLAEGLKRFLGTVAFVALAAAVIVAVFIVWWLALVLGAAFFAFWYLRRLIRGKPAAAPGDPGVIEGDYRVEPDHAFPPAGQPAAENPETPVREALSNSPGAAPRPPEA